MLLLNDWSELLLPMPAYLVAVLVGLAIWAWRQPRTTFAWRGRQLITVLAVWSWLLSTPVIADLAVRQIEGDPQAPIAIAKSPRTLVVVLASGELWSDQVAPQVRLDLSGWRRIYAGVTLWRNTGGKLLLVGGPGDDQSRSLAATMAGVALELGVPESAILRSGRSRNTYEDLAFAAPLIRAEPHDTIWLVTSALHMHRALAVARGLGLQLSPYPCDYQQLVRPTWRAWLPNNGGPESFAALLHEWVGSVYYAVRGRAEGL
ncbi:MAG TPA: YdcF family protein [Burkholderiaceae bacterium]|nr:YdcF family protein [Burkholderiaceae bacterium]